jgi:glycosyltransferase involved in cell wall biosynthesis
MSAPTETPRIACLTGEYPKASHTFILREIAALRTFGAEVLSASIRRTAQAQLIGPEEEAEAARTFHVLETARRPGALLSAHLSLLTQAPGRYLATLALALRTGRPGARGTLWQLFYFAEAGVLAAHLRREGVGHLHNHFADSSANVAMLAAGLGSIPFSFTLHGPAELFEPESWHLGEKIARSAFTVCISHFARSQAMLFSDPADWGKLRIVHCGVEPVRYDADPPEAREGLRLLFVGRLTAIKGLRVLFAALESVRAERPDVTLTLIGDGEDRAWAEAEAARIGGIALLGFRSQGEVAEAVKAADAFVLPSFAEGVPVVLMEAMAAARPVIATRVGGVAELVEDGVSGHLVAPGDPEALAAAIRALAQDPASRARMGQAGRAKVRAEFDVGHEARRLLALYRGQGGEAIRPRPAEAA